MTSHTSGNKFGLGWKETWKQPAFRFQFFLFVFVIAGIAAFFPGYFDYLEQREGTLINDIVVSLFPSHDYSWMVFFFLYTGILIGLVCSLKYPKMFLMIMETYAMVTVMRIITLYFTPLNPPVGYIELKEPVLSLFFTTNGKICSKDLFFSGHVSTILSFYFPVRQKPFKQIILIFSIMVGLLVVLQHVHYTIDVVVSPLATYGCYLLSKAFTKKIL